MLHPGLRAPSLPQPLRTHTTMSSQWSFALQGLQAVANILRQSLVVSPGQNGGAERQYVYDLIRRVDDIYAAVHEAATGRLHPSHEDISHLGGLSQRARSHMSFTHAVSCAPRPAARPAWIVDVQVVEMRSRARLPLPASDRQILADAVRFAFTVSETDRGADPPLTPGFRQLPTMLATRPHKGTQDLNATDGELRSTLDNAAISK